ncbi:MAG: hypothetical protein AB7T49_21455 [Oligoflexales bacterium]
MKSKIGIIFLLYSSLAFSGEPRVYGADIEKPSRQSSVAGLERKIDFIRQTGEEGHLHAASLLGSNAMQCDRSYCSGHFMVECTSKDGTCVCEREISPACGW